ncbi:SDR family NAD(P)-dependent oxidoreductase, partial [uncultured Massilia sp.]|uniref:SDR family NAD(P)-dependent oxidoreductase n=1 Tax=uncultured Massilia sp. TaxID=169973 RepID=UPI00258DD524
APVLARNGGGAFVNILSIASWASSPVLANYAVSKSAAWSATNGLRDAVRPQGTQVLGVHVGFIDTDLTRGFEANKLQPATVVDSVFAALEAGDSEVLVDQITRQVKRGLSANTGDYTLVR